MFKIPRNNSQFSPQPESETDSLVNSRATLDFDLEAYFLKLKRRWKPVFAIFFLTVGAAGLLSTKLSTKYEAEGKLLFRSSPLAALTGVAQDSSNLTHLNLDVYNPLYNEREKIITSTVLQKTVEKLELRNEEGEFINGNSLKPNLKVDLLGGTDVIQVFYKDPNPEFAADVVNTIMRVYVEEQIRGNQSEPEIARKFINQQIPDIKARVDRAESELAKFRAENKIVDLPEEKQTIVKEIGNLNRQIALVSSKYRGLKAQTTTLQNEIGLSLEQAIAADQLGNEPVVNSIIDNMTVTENRLIRERRRFKEGHPNIVSLQEKKANLNRQLQKLVSQTIGQGVQVSPGLIRNHQYKPSDLEEFIRLKIQELSLRRQSLALAQAQQIAVKRAREIPQLDNKEQELLLEYKIADKNYQNLLDSLQEVELAAKQDTSNVEIVEPAIVPRQGTSSRMKLLALGVMGGLFFSHVAAFFLESRDRSLKTISEIRKKLPYTILGIIPQDKDVQAKQKVIVAQAPDSYTSEIYRLIQTNLTARNSQITPKVILVTSSIPGEGKSTVTANLAAAMCQLGSRVLLIDGDLRKPTQHLLWHREDCQGIREVIHGETELADAVTQPIQNLDLLASGEVVSNPLAILDSHEIEQLITTSRRKYDLVLIDAPPLPVTADILTLNKLVDGILFVSRSGVVENESADLAQEILITIQDKILGMVVNGVDAEEFNRYAYSVTKTKQHSQKKFALIQ
ncbi:MAG: polysaccharide biosynthesis tyrosine autokinase [Xenococcus sp. MO_188.B8]|nr:polysaccharide biosynthesis tyrosine autokinase [Xenococcus sp. MO_188.B8]